MSLLDVDQLLAPISPEEPCGENLEYDADYAAMELAGVAKPDQEYGKTTIAGEEPDWKEVESRAITLLGRTKDLRVAMHLVRGAAWNEGLDGLADGMAVLSGLVEKYWDGIHPRLDPEDGNDPTFRLNAIAGLCDPATMLKAVQSADLVSSRGLGRFCYRDVQVALGELPPAAGSSKIEQSAIDGAFADCDGGQLKATAKAVAQALAATKSLESTLDERVGPGVGPPLDAFSDLLKALDRLLTQKLAARGLTQEDEMAESTDERPLESADQTAPEDGNGHASSAAASGRKAFPAQWDPKLGIHVT